MSDRLLGTDPTSVQGDAALVVLTRAAMRVAVPFAVLITVGAFLFRGVAGGITALAAATMLLGLHVGSARITARLSKGKPQLMPAYTMLTLIVRLTVYGVLILIFGDVAGVDVPVLAVTVITLTFAMLLVETSVVARYSKFWWQPTEVAETRPLERTEA